MKVIEYFTIWYNIWKMIKTLTMHNNDTTRRHIGMGPNVPWCCTIIVHKECKDHSPFSSAAKNKTFRPSKLGWSLVSTQNDRARRGKIRVKNVSFEEFHSFFCGFFLFLFLLPFHLFFYRSSFLVSSSFLFINLTSSFFFLFFFFFNFSLQIETRI
jgi:hypothetical protein